MLWFHEKNSTFFSREVDKSIGAVEATYDADKGYIVETQKTTKMFPIRLRLQEDRIMKIEKKFFCDKKTEKTINLTVCFKITQYWKFIKFFIHYIFIFHRFTMLWITVFIFLILMDFLVENLPPEKSVANMTWPQ